MMALNDALNGRIDHLLARARLAAIFRISLPYFVAGGNTVVDHGGCATSDPRGVWLRQPNLFRSDPYATSASQMPSWHSAGG